MKRARSCSVLFLLCVCVGYSLSQAPDSAQKSEGVIHKIYGGAVKSLAWYDVPIATVDLAELLFIPSNTTNKPFKFPPTSFDTEFQSHIGVHGPQTIIGRIGEAGLAGMFGVRLLVNIGADLAGADITSEDYHRTFWFYKSIVYTYSITALAKNLVYRERPDGSDGQSFFSGHSSTAFCAASYLSSELNEWYDRWEPSRSDGALRSTLKIGSTVVLFGGATYIAYSRMHDEKHFFSDVAVGAVAGTVVGSLMYRWYEPVGDSPRAGVSFFIIRDTPTMYCSVQF